jgi:hypothetical protein
MTLSATTKLEAINTMLSVIGEAPVSSLAPDATGDVAIAKNILDEVLKEVQTRGWYWNTEYKVVFGKDVGGKIAIPGNVSRVDADVRTSTAHYAIRNGYLYDLTDHTDVFTADATVTAIYLLEWEQLPEVGKRYVMIKAGRVFQDRMMGSVELNAFTMRDEMYALADLKNAEMEVSDFSIFDNRGTFDTINRNSPLDSIGRF